MIAALSKHLTQRQISPHENSDNERLGPLDHVSQERTDVTSKLTLHYSSHTNIVHVTVEEEQDIQFMVEINGKHIHTLWNTGESKSCISHKTYKSMGLK